MTINGINTRALEIRNRMKQALDDPSNPIDDTLGTVPPFVGNNGIRLFVIGQDPTIRNQAARGNIQVTLNLDREGSLRRYLAQICPIEHIYATNVFKYFYTTPPADTPGVLEAHVTPNIELLMEELNDYPGIPVVTLGEPVLSLLVTAGSNKVKDYWGYDAATGETTGRFSHCLTGSSRLNRAFYPFPHQPSLRKTFYANTLARYINYFMAETHL